MPATVSGVERRSRYFIPSFLTECLLRIPEQLLGAAELVDDTALASFLASCQFRFGGIAKAPGERAGLFLSQCAMIMCSEKSLPRPIPHISLSRGDRHVSTS